MITACISPYRAVRDEARELIGNFVEVFVDAPLHVCEQRDVKGLYKKARAGEIKEFTGVSDPYEPPVDPEVIVSTHQETIVESCDRIVAALTSLGYLQERD